MLSSLGRRWAALAALIVGGCASPPPPPAPPPRPSPRHVAGAAVEEPSGIGPESASPVTFAKIAAYPEPGWKVPRKIRFAPDGASVTYLASETGDEKMSLFSMDVASGTAKVLVRAADLGGATAKLSKEEELRRERQRTRIDGITDYLWAESKNVLVVPAKGDVHVRRADGTFIQVKGPVVDPQPCPTGERVAFVRDGGLVVVDAANEKETFATRSTVAGVTRGLSDFNAQEELDEPHGFFWAPDCRRIAYLEVDERGVETVPVVGYKRDAAADRMDQRYPRAGKANPKVTLHVVDTQTRVDRPVALPDDAGIDPYLVRFGWSKDAASLYFQALPRSQKERRLLRVAAATGKVEDVAGIGTTAGWIDPSPFLIDGATVIWLERKGAHMHAVRVGLGREELTSGDFDVFDLHALSKDGATLYATTNRDGVIGRQLDAVRIKGEGRGQPRNLTPEAGVHDVEVSPKADAFIDVGSAFDRPPAAVLATMDGNSKSFGVATDPDIAALEIRPPEVVSTTVDGTKLYGALLRPRRVALGRRYPLVLVVYGGPGAQTVQNRWQPRLLWQHLADRGFFVAQFDNRGSAGRGPSFAEPIAGKLGTVELSDQLAALQDLLKKEPAIDPARVGIYGHSYGGYLAVRAMLTSPKTFRAAAAGSPVSDWRLYDSAYTERYMGSPSSNDAAYTASALPPRAAALEGKLMLLHGLMDENVHFEHMGKLVDALVAAGKPYELVLFPSERHGYRGSNARIYANQRVTDFFARELAGRPPAPAAPAGAEGAAP
jgi:dipeptidyl-peptidase-4